MNGLEGVYIRQVTVINVARLSGVYYRPVSAASTCHSTTAIHQSLAYTVPHLCTCTSCLYASQGTVYSVLCTPQPTTVYNDWLLAIVLLINFS